MYTERKDALSLAFASIGCFREASKGEIGGKRGEMSLVCEAFMNQSCNTENCKVVGAKGGCFIVVRAMRIFRLDAECVEKRRNFFPLVRFACFDRMGRKWFRLVGRTD